jgi:site-specific DNA-adenine methylase
LDPPFSVQGHRVFKEYNSYIFDLDDLRRLREWMKKLAEREIAFVVSYADCEEADFLRRGFFSEVATVRRNIAGFAESRHYSREIVISNVRRVS